MWKTSSCPQVENLERCCKFCDNPNFNSRPTPSINKNEKAGKLVANIATERTFTKVSHIAENNGIPYQLTHTTFIKIPKPIATIPIPTLVLSAAAVIFIPAIAVPDAIPLIPLIPSLIFITEPSGIVITFSIDIDVIAASIAEFKLEI
ncbi:hypothetical protein NX059_002794 [Plenodomus lindquistii]|nr:hypothetical protein NX059_002794 [Plenodomus lindquistii]